MQAIEVEEHFHAQQAYANPSDLAYFKRNKIKQFLVNDTFKKQCNLSKTE